ncbi:lactonase family protein [Actinophytocola oryzae]|uniref:6-phosphogluconolactonase n=1 Tax=Actinophytocola oryzae TaxID=502181 RepID=A0A4R7VX88_9PSEU|nr:lactonase family protein [Actinophytocola oryzae]TDV54268.1 6-phosphogluconolactonase [Actinophytocola oryzae]
MTENPSRRTILGALAAVPVLAGASGAVPSRDLVHIGTWKGQNVHGAWFDPVRGDLTPIGPVGVADADWSVPHPTLPILYVATLEEDGVVYTFRVDRQTGTLTKTGEVATGGAGMGGGGVSFIAVDRPSSTLLVANFEAGLTAALPISRTGVLGPPTSVAQDTGSGPNPRQNGPHPHHVAVDPTGRFVLVADFGADQVFVHPFHRATRTLSVGGSYRTAPGSGPRRVAFHPDGRTVYLLNELTADLQTLRWHPEGGLTHRQTLPTNAPDHTGTTSASDLAVAGRFVYTGNRGENSLVVHAIDPRTHLLRPIQRVPCAGVTPWSFSVHPNGHWLLVANEASNTVNVFGIDRATGRLTDTGRSIPVPNPDSITFCRR